MRCRFLPLHQYLETLTQFQIFQSHYCCYNKLTPIWHIWINSYLVDGCGGEPSWGSGHGLLLIPPWRFSLKRESGCLYDDLLNIFNLSLSIQSTHPDIDPSFLKQWIFVEANSSGQPDKPQPTKDSTIRSSENLHPLILKTPVYYINTR